MSKMTENNPRKSLKKPREILGFWLATGVDGIRGWEAVNPVIVKGITSMIDPHISTVKWHSLVLAGMGEKEWNGKFMDVKTNQVGNYVDIGVKK